MSLINFKSLKSLSYILFVLILGVFTSCSESGSRHISSKDLTAFSFPQGKGVITNTSATAGTIAVTVPFNTTVTGLVATFTTTGSYVAVGATAQVNGTTANDFAGAVTYTVTAADKTTKAYVVTVTIAPKAPGYKVTFTGDGVSFKMAYVPGGLIFPTGIDDAGTATVPHAYWIGETDVTYELWNAVCTWAIASGGYHFANVGHMGGGFGTTTNQHPVTTISWRDAMVFSNAITEWYNFKNETSYGCVYKASNVPIRDSRNTNATQCDAVIPDTGANGFRLLTSNEWELAARWRGSDATNTVSAYTNPYFTKGSSTSGATADCGNATASATVAWFNPSGTTNGTEAVKLLTPNALGLYDMSGNVWVWNFDLAAPFRVARGGSWADALGAMQLGEVNSNYPYYADYNYGFRISRTDL